MANVTKKYKQKPHKEESIDELRKRDALALAALIYDIYQDKKRKEQSNEVLQDIRETPQGV